PTRGPTRRRSRRPAPDRRPGGDGLRRRRRGRRRARVRTGAGVVSQRFTARSQVAVVGYAQSPIQRHAEVPLGALAIDTALAAIADAGLTKDDIDGFTTGALLPTAGGHAVVDGVSVVTANWLAEHLGINPRFCAGFQGFGQIPGAVTMAVNALATGAADYVL